MRGVIDQIDKQALIRLRNEKKSKAYCAKYFNVSESSIAGALKRLKKELNNAPPPDADSKSGIDSMKQLANINQEIYRHLSRCNNAITRIEKENSDIDKLIKSLQFNPNDIIARDQLRSLLNANLKNTLAVQKNMIEVSTEIRKQIELQLKIAEVLHGIEVVAEFKAEILQILGEELPEAAGRFYKRLKERKAARGLISLS